MPISLGRRKSPIDLTFWNALCYQSLGRYVSLGEQLSKDELSKLGFTQAGQELPKDYQTRGVIERKQRNGAR